VAESSDLEFRRKVRVAAGGLASVWARRRLLDPRHFGFYSIQLFSHKVLRRAVGLPLVVTWLASIVLAGVHPIYALACLAQTMLHVVALVGWWLRDRPVGRRRWLSIPVFFDLVNLAGAIAFVDLLRGKRYLHWSPERGSETGA
jgi:hypothetical protein